MLSIGTSCDTYLDIIMEYTGRETGVNGVLPEAAVPRDLVLKTLSILADVICMLFWLYVICLDCFEDEDELISGETSLYKEYNIFRKLR